MLPARRRDLLALAIAGIALAAGVLSWSLQQPDVGITIGARDGDYGVVHVTPGGEADRVGIRPGATVLLLNGRPATTIGEGWEWVVDTATVEGPSGVAVTLDIAAARAAYAASIGVLILSWLLLVGATWWLRSGVLGEAVALAFPLASASAVPLLVAPLAARGEPVGAAAAAALVGFGCAVLGDGCASLLDPGPRRSAGVALALLAAGFAAAIPLVALAEPSLWQEVRAVSWLPLLVVPVVPALAWGGAARPRVRRTVVPEGPGTAWLLLAACTPAVAVLAREAGTGWGVGTAVAIAVWVGVLVAWRVVARRVALARVERDLAVTVTEAERSRLSAELHDVALQELTMLVRRLDARGDADGAAMARSVAERLRELCGELHLPILDELGAGSALEWLVDQVRSATGDDVRLVRDDRERPPAGVELAVFRVAQEAIANAVKHGGPPVVVRYAADSSSASLAVEDAGSGVLGPPVEPQKGHYGLHTMRQRSDQIGARFSIERRPGGGTRVSIDWRA